MTLNPHQVSEAVEKLLGQKGTGKSAGPDPEVEKRVGKVEELVGRLEKSVEGLKQSLSDLRDKIKK